MNSRRSSKYAISVRISYSGNHVQKRFRGNLVHVWSPKGDKVQTLRYDSQDRVVEEQVGNAAYTLSYGPSAAVTTVTDRSSNTTKWTFASDGMPLKKEVFTKGLRTGEPTSFSTVYGVDATNRMITSVVHPRGNRTDYTYDSNLNLIEVRHKTANTSSNGPTDVVHAWTYGVCGQKNTYTDPRGNTTRQVLSPAGASGCGR